MTSAFGEPELPELASVVDVEMAAETTSSLDKLVKAHLSLLNECINLQHNKPSALCGTKGEIIKKTDPQVTCLPGAGSELIGLDRAGELLLVVTH